MQGDFSYSVGRFPHKQLISMAGNSHLMLRSLFGCAEVTHARQNQIKTLFYLATPNFDVTQHNMQAYSVFATPKFAFVLA